MPHEKKLTKKQLLHKLAKDNKRSSGVRCNTAARTATSPESLSAMPPSSLPPDSAATTTPQDTVTTPQSSTSRKSASERKLEVNVSLSDEERASS